MIVYAYENDRLFTLWCVRIFCIARMQVRGCFRNENDRRTNLLLPLEGITVLDVSRLIPGPYCSQLLGDLGATIIKVEDTIVGDYARSFPPYCNGESSIFLSINRNKKSLSLNLKSEKGKKIFFDLVKGADVILEGFRPGVVDRLGIGYEQIKTIKEDIIYCSISGFGQDGPYRDLSGHDLDYAALAGILDLTGKPDGDPIMVGVAAADFNSGLFAAFSILAAVIHKGRAGKGQYIDVSMFDCLLPWISIFAASYFSSGEFPSRGWSETGPVGVFKSKDSEYFTMGVVEDWFWQKLCEVLERPDLSGDPRYVTFAGRQEQGIELRGILVQLFLEKDRDEWLSIFAKAGIPAGPVHHINEVFNDPHVKARNLLIDVDHPRGGKMKNVNFPVKFSGLDMNENSGPPSAGQHTSEILIGMGYTQEQISKLKEEGVI